MTRAAITPGALCLIIKAPPKHESALMTQCVVERPYTCSNAILRLLLVMAGVPANETLWLVERFTDPDLEQARLVSESAGGKACWPESWLVPVDPDERSLSINEEELPLLTDVVRGEPLPVEVA